MQRKVQLSYLHDSQYHDTYINLLSDVGVVMIIGAALAPFLNLPPGAKFDVADFIVFDFATKSELHLESDSIVGVDRIGFYRRDQTFLPNATPEIMAKAMEFMSNFAKEMRGQQS